MEENISKIKKVTLIACGHILTVIGVIGIFLPILPTMPFLLLAAVCFYKSSRKHYNRMINTKFIGTHLKNYLENKEMSKGAKIFSIVFLWSSILLSVVFFVKNIYLRIFVLLVAVFVTIHLVNLKHTDKYSFLILPNESEQEG